MTPEYICMGLSKMQSFWTTLFSIVGVLLGAIPIIIAFGRVIIRNEEMLKRATEHPNSLAGIVLFLYNKLLVDPNSFVFRPLWSSDRVYDKNFYSIVKIEAFYLQIFQNTLVKFHRYIFLAIFIFYFVFVIYIAAILSDSIPDKAALFVLLFVVILPLFSSYIEYLQPQRLRIEGDYLYLQTYGRVVLEKYKDSKIKRGLIFCRLLLVCDNDKKKEIDIELFRYPRVFERLPGHVEVERIADVLHCFIEGRGTKSSEPQSSDLTSSPTAISPASITSA